jgi:hypothetical protein
MATTRIPPLYDEFLDFLIDKASPEEILAFQASPEAREQAQLFLERNSAGTLTLEEQQTLTQMVEFERFMGLLKAKALRSLSNQ